MKQTAAEILAADYGVSKSMDTLNRLRSPGRS